MKQRDAFQSCISLSGHCPELFENKILSLESFEKILLTLLIQNNC